MKFPLYSHHNETLVSLSGETSFLYKLEPIDIEQVEDNEVVISEFEKALNLCNTNWAKIYSVDSELYINAKENIVSDITGSELIKAPLEILFKNLNSDIEFYEDYYVIDSKYYRIISFESYMDKASICTLEGLDFCLIIKKQDARESKAKLLHNRRMHFSALFKGIKDIESENSYSESEELLEKVIRNETTLYKMQLHILLNASTKEELDLKTKVVVDDMKAKNAIPIIETRATSFFFSNCIPGVSPNLKRAKLAPSSYITNIIPLTRDTLMVGGINLKARSGNLINFDLFSSSATNFNLLITGSSGQGKSMMANKLINEELGRGSKGIILDLGNSFKKNVLYNQGVIFSEKINPLQFRNAKYLKEFIIAGSGEVWSRPNEGKLYEAIKENLNASSFAELIEVLSKDFKDLPYYFSELKDLFTEETLELNDLSYCDLTLYPESFKAPLMIYLIEYFKHLEGKKIFVFDECWGMLKHNADYISECFRTFRKHEASAIAISQNLNDFSKTQLGEVIIQNTYFKFLFNQKISGTDFLTEFQEDLLADVRSLTGKYSEFLVLTEDIQKITRYWATPFEYELFTTSKRDMNAFDHYMKEKGRFLDFRRAVKNYVDIKYTQGEQL